MSKDFLPSTRQTTGTRGLNLHPFQNQQSYTQGAHKSLTPMVHKKSRNIPGAPARFRQPQPAKRARNKPQVRWIASRSTPVPLPRISQTAKEHFFK